MGMNLVELWEVYFGINMHRITLSAIASSWDSSSLGIQLSLSLCLSPFKFIWFFFFKKQNKACAKTSFLHLPACRSISVISGWNVCRDSKFLKDSLSTCSPFSGWEIELSGISVTEALWYAEYLKQGICKEMVRHEVLVPSAPQLSLSGYPGCLEKYWHSRKHFWSVV